jgi:hypothetical protein
MYESLVELRINIHLAPKKTAKNVTYAWSLVPYICNPSQSPYEVEIAPLHLGWNLGSSVITRPCRCPRLPHSPSNNHLGVAVTVRSSSYVSYLVYRTPYIQHASVHNQNLLIEAQPTWSWIDIGEGYHLGAPNIFLSTLHFPIRWYSTCSPLFFPPMSQIKASFHSLKTIQP